MKSLELLSKLMNESITTIMEPHKEVLQDMIPPKKHLLRHQPANAQIGLMVSFVNGVIFWNTNVMAKVLITDKSERKSYNSVSKQWFKELSDYCFFFKIA